MLGKIKKHSVKILVFAMNMLLTAIAVFIILEKDQTRLFEKKQNDLLNKNSSLSDENSFLKYELQSLKGGEDKKAEVLGIDTQVPSIPTSKVVSPSEAPTPANISPPAMKSTSAPNAKTKTS